MQRRLLSAGRLRVADCVVDLDQRTVLTQAGPIRPRPKVFDVLLYLVENRGRLVTKAELLDTLWRDVSVTDDAVMACISEIRRLLGDDARHPRLVLTAPRKGYIFAAPVREDGESGAHKAEGEVPPQTAPRGGPRLRWIALAAGGMAVCAFLAWSLWLTDRSRPALAGWWRLEETGGNVIQDDSGNHNAGVLFGSPNRVRGPHGGALEFAAEGYVNAAAPANRFPSGDSPLTVSLWTRGLQESRTSGGTFFHFGGTGWDPPRSNMLMNIGATGRLAFGFGFGYEVITGRRNLLDGKWHHLAATYAGPATNRLEIYADGESEGNLVSAQPANIARRAAWTMGISQGGSEGLQGDIADLRLYRGALSHPQVAALYRCGLERPDLPLPGRRAGYYLPLYRATISAEPRTPEDLSVPFVYDGFGRGGVEFAASDRVCALESLKGASIGRNVRLGVDVQIASSTEAGPFFRARRVTPGDPVEGRGNGGYWVRLRPDGALTLSSLNQPETQDSRVLAVSSPVAGFDRTRFHRVEIEAARERVRVWLDGQDALLDGRPDFPIPDNGRGEEACGIGFLVHGQPLESSRARNVAAARM